MAEAKRQAGITKETEKRYKRAGAYVKSCRLAADLTQGKVAKALDLEYYTFVSNVENGKNRIPPDQVAEWAAALEASPREFARALLRIYYPDYYRLIFEEPET